MIYHLLMKELHSLDVVIYGAGANGQYVFDYLKQNSIKTKYFIDKNKCGQIVKDLECKSLNDLEVHEKLCVIVTPLINNKVIAEQIEKLGVKHIITWEEMRWIFHIKPYLPDDYIISDYLASNIKFKDKYKGKRCFIVGTGPSIKEQDLTVLKDEMVFTVNNGFKIKDFEALCTDFHVYVDSIYFQEVGAEEDNRSYAESMKKIGKKAQCFFPYQKSHSFIEKYELDQYLNINYIEESMYINLEESIIDFTKPTALTGTVVLTAVLLAIYMGFSEIYLLGCDCTDIFTSIGAKIKDVNLTEYAWDNEKNDHNRIQNTLGQRSLESIYHVQYIKFKNFRIINEICDLNQIKLFNCTKGGILDCVKRKNFEDLFIKNELQ